jgi:N-acylglucosamine-6-phosphate 2-epimerase
MARLEIMFLTVRAMTKDLPPVARKIHSRLIVSCQAREGEPFRDPAALARFACAAVMGGAAAIRAQGPDNIRAIREAVDVPILGLWKQVQEDGRLLITPTFESAQQVVAAGAEMIALDVTRRGRHYGALDRLRRIRQDLNVPVFADIATIDEALIAADSGADFVLSTMRGYTDETEHIHSFDLPFIEELVRSCPVPVIAEGRIETPEQARAALAAGAYSVVVGSAITRPHTITRRFVDALVPSRPTGDLP